METSQRILLSGASGMIGRHLRSFLIAQGHEVVRLVRHKEQMASDAIYWNPSTGDVDKDLFEDFDAVIHLAGENIAAHRWTKKQQEKIFLSRCRDTWLLSHVLTRLYRPPKTVIAVSSIGYYGNRGGEVLTEESAPGSGFLSQVCIHWEQATSAIENRGSRVVHPRFGAVLSPDGGLLREMLPAFRLGLGGKLGNGKQWISWIAIDDLMRALYKLLCDGKSEGAFNFVTPNPVTQREFAQTLAKQLHRKAFLTLPAPLLRLLFGKIADELLLSSTKAMPERLHELGFKFNYPRLEAALAHLLK